MGRNMHRREAAKTHVEPFIEKAREIADNFGNMSQAVFFWQALRDACSSRIRQMIADHEANISQEAAAEVISRTIPEQSEPIVVLTKSKPVIVPPKSGSLKERIARRAQFVGGNQ